MLPRWHILSGALFTGFIWLIAPETKLIYLALVFLSAFLIDFDHYMVAVYKTGNIRLSNAFEYYEKTGDLDRAVAVAEYPIMHLHFLTAMQMNSVTSMGQLVSSALKLVPPDSHQAARLLCGHLYALGTPPQNDYEGSEEVLSRALSIAQRDKDTALEARALARAGTLDLRHLRWQESVDKALRVVELARDLDDPRK